MTKPSLYGLRVLIPRPHPRGIGLAQEIENHGGTPILFPVIEITDPPSFELLDQVLNDIDAVDLVILVSVSAADGFGSRLARRNIEIPDKLKIAAIGPATAARCRQMHIKVHFFPCQQTDSEGLLDSLSGYDVAGKRIAIMRGQSGREWLQQQLVSMAAEVQCIPCYQRAITRHPIQPIIDDWKSGIDAVVITSVSILNSLIELLGDDNQNLLNLTPVVAISARIEARSVEIGIQNTIISSDTTNSKILEALESLVTQ